MSVACCKTICSSGAKKFVSPSCNCTSRRGSTIFTCCVSECWNASLGWINSRNLGKVSSLTSTLMETLILRAVASLVIKSFSTLMVMMESDLNVAEPFAYLPRSTVPTNALRKAMVISSSVGRDGSSLTHMESHWCMSVMVKGPVSLNSLIGTSGGASVILSCKDSGLIFKLMRCAVFGLVAGSTKQEIVPLSPSTVRSLIWKRLPASCMRYVASKGFTGSPLERDRMAAVPSWSNKSTSTSARRETSSSGDCESTVRL
mmetsp:Transcript_51286/g.130391  ORF Transcript_51286/g.130391 Transcript_51286/m.130391 type:complete len:259 (-) Transcript_51286:1440-2216(-)